MAFPSTPQLTDFSILGDAGPPPTGDYDNGLLFDSMVIASGLCAVDPASMSGYGDAPYTTALTLPVEAWAIIGTIDWPGTGDQAAVYVYDESTAYVFVWQSSEINTFTLYSYNFSSYTQLWQGTDTENYLAEGGGVGIRVTASQVECYYSLDGSTWTLARAESISLASPVQIGLGSFAITE